MVKRRKLHSTFSSVQETVVFDSGTSRTSRANLSKIRQDRLTFEQENQALHQGLLGCSPLQPTIAVSLHCLELYHQIRRRKPSFSIQAMVKVLCALHNTFFQSFRDQFAIAFDAYLCILRGVKAFVDEALQRDVANWRMLHACPPCNFKQPNEPLLYPACLDSIDGNNSLKRVNGSGHADERVFDSSYLIPPVDVEVFKDDVRLRPGTRAATDNAGASNSEHLHVESSCTENWKAANTVSEKTIDVFDQTGVFISACRHGIIQTLVEMRWSGELAKYALATTNKLIDVYGSDGVTGYDIGCSFTKTAAASSIAAKVKSHNHRFVVNSFHGHAHNRRCQLQFHTLYQQGLGIEDLETCERVFSGSNAVAPVIRHASYFHWLQFIDLHFDQWDQDRYQELSQFLYRNYKQALDIINNLTPVVEELKIQLKIVDTDFEHWNIEELEYLESLSMEQEYDPQKIAYAEALQSLTKAEAEYGGVTSNSGLRKPAQAVTKVREAERQAMHHKLLLSMNVVLDLERRLSVETRWTPNDVEYQQASAYLTNRRFVRAVEQLEGLVVQRLFELAKSNLAGTGYKMRQHISNAITRRSTAIRNALERYNHLAPLQTPPRDVLKFSEVASYAWLGEFELLKHSRSNMLDKPWAVKSNREVAAKYFRIVRAREEIHRLNIEIARLQKWVDTEDAHMLEVSTALAMTNPVLAREIQWRYEEHRHVNNLHRVRLEAVYNLAGYSGAPVEQGTCGARGIEEY
ncbi:hypothetical protein EV424DRAFT_1475992 [Suillus variegatus]|nr:hypothetical protein EV424DRAFT_1475992 [Suillus variegatus]